MRVNKTVIKLAKVERRIDKMSYYKQRKFLLRKCRNLSTYKPLDQLETCELRNHYLNKRFPLLVELWQPIDEEDLW